jgi:hypothetical protein
MKIGTWLMPRYTDRSVFEKDFGLVDMNAMDVYCPGCKAIVRLGRKSAHTGKIGGWCVKCNRPVAA